jgi:hypothetical protein
MTFDLSTYGAVVTFEILSQTHAIQGLAAPRAGFQPAALRLDAGGETIAAVRASRYSASAAAAGLRAGWCAFELPGVAKAFAISSDVSVRCLATDAVLATITPSRDVFAQPSDTDRPLTALEVFKAGSAGERCESIDEVIRFATDHRDRHGIRSLVDATFQMLTDSLPDTDDLEEFLELLASDEGVATFLTLMQERSGESPHRAFPGPFHSAFRYDRSLLS